MQNLKIHTNTNRPIVPGPFEGLCLSVVNENIDLKPVRKGVPSLKRSEFKDRKFILMAQRKGGEDLNSFNFPTPQQMP